jgi:hypothetical protein
MRVKRCIPVNAGRGSWKMFKFKELTGKGMDEKQPAFS